MKKGYYFIVISLFISCADKLIEKPENLISEEKIENILYDLSLMTAAKNINPKILKNNDIKIMEYLFTKYEVDSLQFVKSNEYYAGVPSKHQGIYENVEKRLIAEKENIALLKKQKDSIKKLKIKLKDSISKIK